jgi:Family of unknown function (DUF5519)
VSDAGGDALWDAFVATVLPLGRVDERVSRYGNKPAVYVGNREIAHLEAPGVIDLRITQQAWRQVRDQFGADPAVRKEKARRDWLEMVLTSAADLDRLVPLVVAAVASNA